MTGEALLIGTVRSGSMIEICRSATRHINLENHGGPRFESKDFFASRKITCDESIAREESARIYAECEEEVLEAANAFVKKMKAAQRKPAAQENAA